MLKYRHLAGLSRFERVDKYPLFDTSTVRQACGKELGMGTVGKFVAMATLVGTAMAVADPVCDSADLVHRWSFNGNVQDSVGGFGLTAISSGISLWRCGNEEVDVCSVVYDVDL